MRVEDVIHIAASPDVVWMVTRDVERWPEWTPTVKSVRLLEKGLFGVGCRARIRQPLQPESVWVVTEFVPGERFAWRTSRPGLEMTGRHELSPAGVGTRNTLSVEAKGALALISWPLLSVAMSRALAAENRGLKARCEEISEGAGASAVTPGTTHP